MAVPPATYYVALAQPARAEFVAGLLMQLLLRIPAEAQACGELTIVKIAGEIDRLVEAAHAQGFEEGVGAASGAGIEPAAVMQPGQHQALTEMLAAFVQMKSVSRH